MGGKETKVAGLLLRKRKNLEFLINENENINKTFE